MGVRMPKLKRKDMRVREIEPTRGVIGGPLSGLLVKRHKGRGVSTRMRIQ